MTWMTENLCLGYTYTHHVNKIAKPAFPTEKLVHNTANQVTASFVYKEKEVDSYRWRYGGDNWQSGLARSQGSFGGGVGPGVHVRDRRETVL